MCFRKTFVGFTSIFFQTSCLIFQNRNQFAEWARTNSWFFFLPPQPETHGAHSAPNGFGRRMGSKLAKWVRKCSENLKSDAEWARLTRRMVRLTAEWARNPPNMFELSEPIQRRMGSNLFFVHFRLPTAAIRKVSPFGAPNGLESEGLGVLGPGPGHPGPER